jgi:hypothetical protein
MGGYLTYCDGMASVSPPYLYGNVEKWNPAAWHGISGLYMIISLSQKAQGSTWIETFFYGVFDKYMDYLST